VVPETDGIAVTRAGDALSAGASINMQDIFDPDGRPLDEEETAAILGVKVMTLASMRSQGRCPR
jgi:hypothetical protein